jgi:hypothetical protein
MHKQTFAALVATVVASATQAADLESRYGLVEALSISESTFTVTFEGKQLAMIEAAEVSLSRVTPNGKQEHIVIEKWKPGLNCHKSYVLLTITPDKKTSVSPSFGECTDLQAATYLKDGVRIKLRASYNSDAKHPKMISYTWVNGQLSKR